MLDMFLLVIVVFMFEKVFYLLLIYIIYIVYILFYFFYFDIFLVVKFLDNFVLMCSLKNFWIILC